MRSVLPQRTWLAFFVLGTLNNLTFVVNNSDANDILPGNVGVIYAINCVPELLLKATCAAAAFELRLVRGPFGKA